MCGIAGIVGEGAGRYGDRLVPMLDAIAHRGPDGDGVWQSPQCLLGHRRLSIIDLAGGAQPMRDEETGTVLTFNGEVYGYRELRAQCHGYPFRTSSDTEVILALYRRQGADFVRHLPGMFAFALWDPRERLLLCARDRFGEKPFYYATTGSGLFVFGSEIKAIAAADFCTLTVSPAALEHYCRRHYVHPKECIYEEVRTLPPGHLLTFSNGTTRIHRYWSAPPINANVTLEDAAVECRRLVKQAVSRQLVADVPVGLFLSGGLDSSTVTAVAAGLGPELHTFAFDVAGGIGELPFARDVATMHGTVHRELGVGSFDIATEAERQAHVFDEPFGDSSAIPMFLMAREARRHVKVALTGDGGDELFGGYSWYQPLTFMHSHGDKHAAHRFMIRLRIALRRKLGLESAQDWAESSGLALIGRFPTILSAHEAQLQLISDAALAQLGLGARVARDPWGEIGATYDSGVAGALLADALDYMPGDILVKLDRTSMANGIELRAPFLDVHLAEFLLSLPPSIKVGNSRDKILLRAAFAEQWPPSVRARRKQGFGGPLRAWLGEPRVRALASDVLHTRSSALFDLLDYAGAQRLLNGASPLVRWGLLMLGLWANVRPRTTARPPELQRAAAYG
jgi:asparagine synthase (glutamine-hydrolysing)